MATRSELQDGTGDVSQARSNPIQVLAKAGAVLDALDSHGELTAAELADVLDEPRSSVYRLLASLEELGFVSRGVRRGTVQLGLKLYRLGTSAVQSRDLRSAALASMTELHNRTDSTIFLAVRSEFRVVCIERIEGRWTVNNALLPGTTGPLHVGAVGKILLAAEPPEFWDEYCRTTTLERFTPNTITDRDELFRVLEKVRSDGFSTSDEDRLLGMAGVGAPIRDHDGRIVAAIALSGPRPTVLGESKKRSVALIREAAETVSATLGHVGQPAA